MTTINLQALKIERTESGEFNANYWRTNMTRIEYWPTSEGIHVVEISPSGARCIRILYTCKRAAELIREAM